MLKELPLRMHHHAYAVKDQEANRHFIEDILGAGITADAIRAELRREGRIRSEHPGRMRDRLTPKESTRGNRSRPDAGDFDPNREYPSAARPSAKNCGGTSSFCKTLPVSNSTLRSEECPFSPVLSYNAPSR